MNEMNNINKSIIKKILILALVLYYSIASFSFTALAETIIPSIDDQVSFFLMPDKEKFLASEFLYVDVKINTGAKTANAINLSLSFATSSLLLISSTTNESLCSLVATNTVNNLLGDYNLQCEISPQAYFDTTIIRLKFKKIQAGFTKLIINKNSAVLANNGLGTNILTNREIHNVFIVK